MYSYYHIWQLIYPSSLPTLNLYKLRSLFACCIFSEVFHFILILSRYYIVFWKIDSLLSVLHAESFHLYVIKSWSLSLEMQNYPKIFDYRFLVCIANQLQVQYIHNNFYCKYYVAIDWIYYSSAYIWSRNILSVNIWNDMRISFCSIVCFCFRLR